MTRLARPLFGLCALAFLAGGCADLQSARGTPKLGTENGCFVAPDTARCRLDHDLAGGYPITRGGGRG